jgi:hypothetical protein
MKTDLERARVDMVGTYMSGADVSPISLARRTGNLVESWKVRIEETADTATGQLRQDQRFRSRAYAKTHEYGKVINARRAQNLAIPLTDEAENVKSPRDIDNLFLIRSRRGNVLLVRRDGRRIEPMFLLKPSVRIPARPYIRPTSAKWFPIILGDVRREVAQMARELGAANA